MNGKAFTEQTAQIALQQVLAQIEEATNQAGRKPGSVKLLAVSKRFPVPNLLSMADCGQRAFGENYLQEALEKQVSVRDERPDLQLEWHFIGAIQSNKTRPVAENFDWVHTVDREKIASRLNDQRPADAPPLNVCIQVNIDHSESKSGCSPAEAPALALAVSQMPQLRLRGLMAIPAPSDDEAVQRAAFTALRELSVQLKAQLGVDTNADPDLLDTLSMGMTSDLSQAIAEGSTMVRIGTALFGKRSN